MKLLTRCLLVMILFATTTDSARALDLWPFNNSTPAKKSSAVRKSKEPSVLQKMSRGTKRMWSQTTDALTPDSWSSKSNSQKKKTASSSSNSRFGGKPEKREPQTVSEWIAQPRLDP